MGIRCLLVEVGLVSWIREEDHFVTMIDVRWIMNLFSTRQQFPTKAL